MFVRSLLMEVKDWAMTAPIVARARETVSWAKRRPKIVK